MITPAARKAAASLRDRRGSSLVATGPDGAEGAVGAGIGNGIATVAVGGGLAKAVARRAAGAIGTVEAITGGVITMVLAVAGADVPSIAALSASTNAADDSHRAAGSLASPRAITASTCGPSDGLRELGSSGSRWTCAYSSSISASPSNG